MPRAFTEGESSNAATVIAVVVVIIVVLVIVLIIVMVMVYRYVSVHFLMYQTDYVSLDVVLNVSGESRKVALSWFREEGQCHWKR